MRMHLAGLLALTVAPLAAAQVPLAATVFDLRPVAQLLAPAAVAPELLHAGQALYLGQQVHTEPSGRLGLVLADGSVLRLEGGSDLELQKPVQGLGVLLKLAKGLLRLDAAKQHLHQLLIETPNATAGVKGTQYQVDAQEKSTAVQVLEGSVALTPKSGGPGVLIHAGEMAVSYPDRVDAVRKLSFEEVKALRSAMRELVEQKKLEYAKRVREAKGKRSRP